MIFRLILKAKILPDEMLHNLSRNSYFYPLKKNNNEKNYPRIDWSNGLFRSFCAGQHSPQETLPESVQTGTEL
jgi:hypothetical protein